MSEDNPPVFFIPGCAPEEQEKVYATMASDCENVPVPGIGKRIYAISHHHDGDQWFVTVGKTLTGRRPVWKGRKKTADTFAIENPALVLAFFRFPVMICAGSTQMLETLLEGAQNGRIPLWRVS